MNKTRIRVLVGKPGDGHDRGAKVIARMLRDAGMEVIYSGLHQPKCAPLFVKRYRLKFMLKQVLVEAG